MESDKLKDKDDIYDEDNIDIIPEKTKYEKMLTRKDAKKFQVIPKKIKRLNHAGNCANSGINLSPRHIKLQLKIGNKMIVKNGSKQKYRFFSSRNARE